MKYTTPATAYRPAAAKLLAALKFAQSYAAKFPLIYGENSPVANITLRAAELENCPAYSRYSRRIREAAELAENLRGEMRRVAPEIYGKFAVARRLIMELDDRTDLGIGSVGRGEFGATKKLVGYAADLVAELDRLVAIELYAATARQEIEVAELAATATAPAAEADCYELFMELLGRVNSAATRIAEFATEEHAYADPDNLAAALIPNAELARELEKLAARIGA